MSVEPYSEAEDVLEQACNTSIPRGVDPEWYLPIRNMDNAALDAVLSQYTPQGLERCLGWDGAAQWTWHIRTALGYAIWRRDIGAVRLLVSKYKVNVKADVAQNESSCVHYDGGIRFSSLAYCVEIGAHEPIPILKKAGATKDDWHPEELYNFPGPDPLASFWKSSTELVTKALEDTHHQKKSAKPK
jgi:hypothetical protein